ncbi:uncharacterized protein LOC124644192 isoform X1 [Helicoverpa zea]|uniref:uncharacterized protein LOC124644192 isoform X1 n=1 Tax=Helicoverpa zea TaxID=7113 RepID=UPI001F567E94|nr:uncharacterized protein LOC124644192 isoform X1 [Helicoverpa zea]
MRSCAVYLFFIIASVLALQDVDRIKSMGDILCRNCGADIASNRSIISKSSPKCRYSFSDTLFFKEEVLVQVFTTEVFLSYPVISFTYSSCIPTGEWEESTSWFPGYVWKPCICPDCGAYIGFVFQPINPDLVEPPKTFYGLILTHLISEDFLNSLTEYPGSISN